MGKGGIPDRWLDYTPMGKVISGTRFVACKVPLKEALARKLPEDQRFGPQDLMKAFPNIGLLVDLTFTTRYYKIEDFAKGRMQYEKVACPGHVIPPNDVVRKFFMAVDRFLNRTADPEALIMVHCTHGVNRTGYFICRYMIQKLKMTPEDAVKCFQDARGHNIERQNYIDDLKTIYDKGESIADFMERNKPLYDDELPSKRYRYNRARSEHFCDESRNFNGDHRNQFWTRSENDTRRDYKGRTGTRSRLDGPPNDLTNEVRSHGHRQYQPLLPDPNEFNPDMRNSRHTPHFSHRPPMSEGNFYISDKWGMQQGNPKQPIYDPPRNLEDFKNYSRTYTHFDNPPPNCHVYPPHKLEHCQEESKLTGTSDFESITDPNQQIHDKNHSSSMTRRDNYRNEARSHRHRKYQPLLPDPKDFNPDMRNSRHPPHSSHRPLTSEGNFSISNKREMQQGNPKQPIHDPPRDLEDFKKHSTRYTHFDNPPPKCSVYPPYELEHCQGESKLTGTSDFESISDPNQQIHDKNHSSSMNRRDNYRNETRSHGNRQYQPLSPQSNDFNPDMRNKNQSLPSSHRRPAPESTIDSLYKQEEHNGNPNRPTRDPLVERKSHEKLKPAGSDRGCKTNPYQKTPKPHIPKFSYRPPKSRVLPPDELDTYQNNSRLHHPPRNEPSSSSKYKWTRNSACAEKNPSHPPPDGQSPTAQWRPLPYFCYSSASNTSDNLKTFSAPVDPHRSFMPQFNSNQQTTRDVQRSKVPFNSGNNHSSLQIEKIMLESGNKEIISQNDQRFFTQRSLSKEFQTDKNMSVR